MIRATQFWLKTQTILFTLVTTLILPANASENTAYSSLIVERDHYEFSLGTYREWLAFMDLAPEPAWRSEAVKALVSKEEFTRYRDGTTLIAERIVYRSDKLRINGFLLTPKSCQQPCPVILYSQGGAAEWGRIKFFDLLEMHRLAETGYIVLASARRGEGGSEGTSNLGAGDLADMLALIDIVDSLPQADSTRINYLGFSRGGALGYRLLAATDRIRSAVMIGAPSDLIMSPRRAEFHEHVYPGVVDGYEEDEEAALRALSALYWPEKLSKQTPLLLLHGAADRRVRPSNSLDLAERLLMLDRPVQLILYADGSHSLIEHYQHVRREIDQWFAR